MNSSFSWAIKIARFTYRHCIYCSEKQAAVYAECIVASRQFVVLCLWRTNTHILRLISIFFNYMIGLSITANMWSLIRRRRDIRKKNDKLYINKTKSFIGRGEKANEDTGCHTSTCWLKRNPK